MPMFPLQSKSFILHLNWNQRENLNRGVEIYWFKVKLWYCYFLTNVDDSNIIIFYYEFKFNIESLSCIEVIDFSENRERQRKAYERKKNSPLQ